MGSPIAMIVRRSEGILTHHPSWRENDKISQSNSRHGCFDCENRENRRVGVIETDSIDGIKPTEIILERRVISMPAHDIKR
jgi:hypothetical protein